MARQSGQKQKLLTLLEILWKETDEAHPLSILDLSQALASRGISAERKSLYSDLETLTDFGFDVVRTRSKSTGYYLGSRPFELVELKLLVDAVQSSKFITEKKSDQLIRKLEELVSRHEASSLSRQVYVAGRIKAMNESIYYTVDEIHRAITKNRKISFQYFSWDAKKNRVLRRDGERYVASPFALLWDDENYYLIAYEEKKQQILHFRVDKMLKIELCEEPREGKELFEKIDLAAYTRRVFGMFGGEEKIVTLRICRELVGVVIDRFGPDVPFLHGSDGTVSVSLPVSVSPQFFGWLASLGEGVSVVSPVEVREGYREHLTKILSAQS